MGLSALLQAELPDVVNAKSPERCPWGTTASDPGGVAVKVAKTRLGLSTSIAAGHCSDLSADLTRSGSG
jgi:hypothetical protein